MSFKKRSDETNKYLARIKSLQEYLDSDNGRALHTFITKNSHLILSNNNWKKSRYGYENIIFFLAYHGEKKPLRFCLDKILSSTLPEEKKTNYLIGALFFAVLNNKISTIKYIAPLLRVTFNLRYFETFEKIMHNMLQYEYIYQFCYPREVFLYMRPRAQLYNNTKQYRKFKSDNPKEISAEKFYSGVFNHINYALIISNNINLAKYLRSLNWQPSPPLSCLFKQFTNTAFDKFFQEHPSVIEVLPTKLYDWLTSHDINIASIQQKSVTQTTQHA